MSTESTAPKATSLNCAVCGKPAGRWQQHGTGDSSAGYGLCRACADALSGARMGHTALELARLYGLPGIHYEPRMHRLHGRDFAILAQFPDTDEGTTQANAYMLAIPGACVLEVTGGRIILAHQDDKGTNAPRPPSDRDQGRKPLPPEQRTERRSLRLTPAQWALFRTLGGNRWLRSLLDDKQQEANGDPIKNNFQKSKLGA